MRRYRRNVALRAVSLEGFAEGDVDRSEFVIAEHLVAREVVGMTVFRPRFYPVAHVGHVDFEEGDGAIPGNLGVEVTHEIAENPQRFVARFAQ